MVVQYLARQTRCPKIQRHTPDKTRLQSGQGRILVIRYLLMRIMGPFELEWGWWNLQSWNKRTICRQRSAVEGLVHVDDGTETGSSRSRSAIDKRYYSPLSRFGDLSETSRSIIKLCFRTQSQVCTTRPRNQLTTLPNATICITISVTAVIRAIKTIWLCTHEGRT